VGEIIERRDNGNTPSVRIGDGQSLVSVKVYQDVYHQVTGRTEQIRKRYSENLLVEFSEIEQLHFKIMQLCDVHNVVARNEVVSVFHDKERKQQFTSFERFRTYNANATSPSVNVVLKYNFSIIPAGLDKPQEYVVTMQLTSRVAMLQQIEADAPPFMRGRIFSYLTANTAEITIDYADYIIARGFLEAFDEWKQGCKANPDIPWLNFLQRWSHVVPAMMKVTTAALTVMFALKAIPDFFSAQSTPETWARFFVIYSGGFYLLMSLVGAAGRMIEEAIDSYSVLSYLKLNKGDAKLIEEFGSRTNRVIAKFVFGCLVTIALGVISSKLVNLV
jgi:hypothetical protein